jgi:HAE1 family hydrophobic/amphiphilic exporter-1
MKQEDPQSMQKELEDKARALIEEEMEIPPGYAISFENAMEEYDRNVESLITALIASLVLVYILLGIQFNSLRVPLIILITVPMGFIGVLLSLYLFKSTLSLNSLLGTILLGGIVVNNAIIMIDFYFRRITEGEERIDALADAAVLRFPPIIITMLTTVLGMLPIALALGDGTNIIQPLGIAVSGGLTVSTLFTLFMIPAVLNLFKVGGQGRLDHQKESAFDNDGVSLKANEGKNDAE